MDSAEKDSDNHILHVGIGNNLIVQMWNKRQDFMIQILNNLSNEHVILDGLETHLMTKGLNMLTMKNNL